MATVDDLVRRRDVTTLTAGDPAAARVPRVASSAQERVLTLMHELQVSNPRLSDRDAARQVFLAHPELYSRYQLELRAQHHTPNGAMSRLMLAQVRVAEFLELVATYERRGLSKPDAVRAATKDDPEGRQLYMENITLTADGQTVAGLRR